MTQVDYVGRVLDNKIRLVKLLGRGGMGAVYLGEHTILAKQVAVKFLHAEFAQSDDVVKRFYREAQAAAAIHHEGIIDVHDVGVTPEGEPFLVMEFLEGESLSAMLDRTGPIPLGAACGIIEPVTLALAAAHAKGIVHRDLKPENIFLAHRPGESPRVKLIDFGISKFSRDGGATKLTQTGSVMGTPAYMAPEQARGANDVDHRADIYSMGVILYQMLTGQLPFPGSNFTEVIVNILTMDPRPPRESYSGFPMEAEAVVLRCLSKDPARRFQTAYELLEALRTLQGFESRTAMLTSLASTAMKRTFAAGDLGGPASTHGTGGKGAAQLLSEVARSSSGSTPWNSTPTGWAGGQSSIRQAPPPRTGLIVGLVAAGVLVVAGLVVAGIFVMRPGTSAPTPIAAPATTAPALPAATVVVETVTITVNGAPTGASIFFDGALVPQNPFKVKKSEAIATVRVDAPGMQAFQAAIVPTQDRVVAATLTPLAAAAPQPAVERSGSRRTNRHDDRGAARTTAPPPPPVSTAPPPPATPKRTDLTEGARGTKIKTDFE